MWWREASRSSLSAKSFKPVRQKSNPAKNADHSLMRTAEVAAAWNVQPLNTFIPWRGKGNALFESVADVQTIVDPPEAAASAGPRYFSDARADRRRKSYRRKSSRKAFTHTCADGAKLTDADVIGSVKSLAVPCCRPFTKPYDRAELIADAILHAAWIGFALTGLALLISMAGGLPGFQGTSVWIYGVGLVTVVATSAAYNAWPLGSTKLLLRRFDQSAIFLFIAATYTPIIAQTDRVPNNIFLVVIWTLACLGLVLKLAFPCRFERLAILLCLAMGWSGLLAYDVVFSPLAPATVCLIAAGGGLYSIGVVFHLWDNLRFQNAIWHGFVLSAAGLQFIAVFHMASEAAAATG
jgi:hemolysin III